MGLALIVKAKTLALMWIMSQARTNVQLKCRKPLSPSIQPYVRVEQMRLARDLLNVPEKSRN